MDEVKEKEEDDNDGVKTLRQRSLIRWIIVTTMEVIFDRHARERKETRK